MISVEALSAAPCHANSLISVSTRRCDSMAKASSSRNAASRLTNWLERDSSMGFSAAREEVGQHAQHAEKKSRGQELGGEEQAQLGEQRLQQREAGAGEGKLCRQRRERERERSPVARLGNAPGQEKRDADAYVSEQLDRHGPFDQRQMARRGFQ